MTIKELGKRMDIKKFNKVYGIVSDFYLEKNGNVSRNDIFDELKSKLSASEYSEEYIEEILDIFEK